ncbi:MAG TPA: Nramp family divalent metal transporter [Saprospiraceae bacterium]|nr:Nramp family divalent metal transporter [Saprospiraceae bacterium]HPI07682.1 Nramp family divalent metal transporter [Saprospiraceae bacterium]
MQKNQPNAHPERSLSEVHSTVETNVKGGFWRRLFVFLGPAYLVSVGYMDPGNWATDLAGGSRFGYSLLWVLLMSNLIALLLQSMCARLGVVAQRDLAQASRELYHPAANIFNYILAEIAIASCDLAEVVGMAIGLQLLFGFPLIWGVGLSVLDAFLILFLMQLGIRRLEAFILALVLIIGGAFAIQMLLAKPQLSEVVVGFIPSIPNSEALFIAIGIIGATVMPHNLYLHSALVQSRKVTRDPQGLRRAIRYNIIDSAIALNLALFVNAAILILAAAVFYKNGYNGVSEIQDAHRLLEPLLGKSYAPALFAIALIAAGQSSTVTGTLAGQIVMEGYLHLRIAPWLRRLITRLLAVVPAVIVISYFGESSTGDMLVMSQVILSMQLGFAIIPLLHYVSSKKRMGEYAIGFWAKVGGWASAVIIVSLNVRLVVDQVRGWLANSGEHVWAIQWIVIPFLLGTAVMLGYIVLRPLLVNLPKAGTKVPHGNVRAITTMQTPDYQEIAIAVDFSEADQKTLEHALHIGGKSAKYFLIHAVETAGAWVMGNEIQDYETHADIKYLQEYETALIALGYQCESVIGYGPAKQAIPKLVNDKNVDLLVMGAHGHRVMKDLIFGTTIGAVRHAVSIPVLIVR